MNDRELLEPAAWLLCEMIYCLDEEPFVQRTVCLTKFNEDCEPLYLHPPQPQATAPINDFDLRGVLASNLLCWKRLTEAEAQDLVCFFEKVRITQGENK